MKRNTIHTMLLNTKADRPAVWCGYFAQINDEVPIPS